MCSNHEGLINLSIRNTLASTYITIYDYDNIQMNKYEERGFG